MIPVGQFTVSKRGLASAIRALFANGEQGAWYDPSDTGTLYQDSAGTTPVTAVEQPVGLMLDKSKGLVLGSEKIINGLFSSASGWTLNTNVAITNSRLEFTSAAASYLAFQDGGANFYGNGRFYQIEFDYSTNINLTILLSGTGVASILPGTGRYKGVGFATNDTLGRFQINANAPSATGWIDNISVKELPGNHAFQATSASRPVLSARYNLLTATSFSGAVAGTPGTAPADWPFNSGGGSITSVSGGVISFSVTGARQIIGQTVTLPANAKQVWRVVVESNPNNLAFFQLFVAVNSTGATLEYFANGVSVDNVLYVPVAGDVLSAVLTNGVTQITPVFRIGVGASRTATGSASFSRPDVRVFNIGVNLLPYQRVNTATDYDTVGFPPYLRFNGGGSAMLTNSIDFSGTDKMTVWAGLQKLSDAAVGIFTELSASITNVGTFNIRVPRAVTTNAALDVMATANGSTFAVIASNAITTPGTFVMALAINFAELAGSELALRINGSAQGTNTGDAGSGNFGNYPLYIGARAGTSTWFNGRLYGLVVRGAQSNAAQIERGETYMNVKTGKLW